MKKRTGIDLLNELFKIRKALSLLGILYWESLRLVPRLDRKE